MTAAFKHIWILIAVVLAVAAVPNAGAEEKGCAVQTLRGAYMYSSDGFVASGPGQGPFTPVAEAGIYIFDGGGHFTTVNTLSFGGQIIPRNTTGSYNMSTNCTGSATIDGGVTFNFAINRSGNEMRFVVSTPSVSAMGTMTRQ